MAKKRGQCVYCGRTGDVEPDHVPPKTLFAPPRPSNLITVPCCNSCNQRFSRDDEYFRLKVGTSDAARGHPDIDKNIPAIIRSLEKPEAIGFTRSFVNSVFYVPAEKDHLGRVVHSGVANHVDMSRIVSVVERCVRGLHYHVHGVMMPRKYTMRTYSDDEFARLPAFDQQEYRRDIIEPVERQPITVIGAGVIAFRFLAHPAMAEQCTWLIQFYRAFTFLVLAGPPIPGVKKRKR